MAERFFTAGRGWIDTASSRAVRLRVFRAERESELAWNDQCATLSTLRHPLLNTLVDYGAGPQGWCFEAYEAGDPVGVGHSSTRGDTILRHVTQFLRASNVDLPPDRAAVAVRPISAGRPSSGRPVGVRLQGRRALDAVEEALEAFSPSGPSVVRVTGHNNAGLRTFRTLIARSARLRGFVPLAPATLRSHPSVLDTLRDRHVCLLDDVEPRDGCAVTLSWLISRLAISSTRRHVVFRFQREPERRRGGIPLDSLSVRALVGMIFTGTDEDPREEELVAAARAADGLPGVFLARLHGVYPATSSRAMVVHERAPEYIVESSMRQPAATIGGRVLGAALRAEDRARALAARGRHAVAVRVLKRAVRVLEGRERTVDAARCAVQLGWLFLDRGHTRDARQTFQLAHRLAGEAPAAITATIGLGVALTDERRLIEAEATLRGALASAETIRHTPALLDAAAALTRCLVWHARHEEAAALATAHRQAAAHPTQAARLLAALARAHARCGRVALAVQTAREAQQAAGRGGPHVLATTELALAEALCAAGDHEGMRAAAARAMWLAKASHLPLVRVRAALLAHAIRADNPYRPLHKLKRLPLPPLLAHRLEHAAEATPRPLEPVAELETLLDISQRASDDASALEEVGRAVAERVGASTVAVYTAGERALMVHGRGWPGVPLAVRQVLAQGTGLAPDDGREPRECVEPIRYGGHIIAALACRWVAGTTVDTRRAGVVLRAAALSAAPHVRALLDRPETPPVAAWTDLLGESAAAAALRESVARAARAPFPVLVEGESGSGKELVARAIHRLSVRRDRRFCALNCAALTDDLVESELFGHVRGAFTGAAAERAGLFEEADGGTLFLDEVGELSARAQAKLLRVLQEGEVRRVGENFPRRVDVRVVAATNRRLEDEVAAGRFRADLRFRLDVVRITVPPLRERATDIPLLATRFWQDASTRVGSRATLSTEALAALSRYEWPGNVRELQNVIAWIAVHSPRRGRIGPSALPGHVAQAAAALPRSFEAAREEFERRFVRAALAGANGQRTRAAAALGVTRQGLAKMMRRLRIEG